MTDALSSFKKGNHIKQILFRFVLSGNMVEYRICIAIQKILFSCTFLTLIKILKSSFYSIVCYNWKKKQTKNSKVVFFFCFCSVFTVRSCSVWFLYAKVWKTSHSQNIETKRHHVTCQLLLFPVCFSRFVFIPTLSRFFLFRFRFRFFFCFFFTLEWIFMKFPPLRIWPYCCCLL